MTSADLGIGLIYFGLSLVALVGVVQLLLLPLFADEFRQRVFALRRELFLLGVLGRIRPDAPAYVRLRGAMNGFLRFAERLSLLRALLGSLVSKENVKAYRDLVAHELELVEDHSVRAELVQLRVRLSREVLRHLLVTSPALWAALAIILPLLLVLIGMKRLMARAIRLATGVEAEVEDDEMASAPDASPC